MDPKVAVAGSANMDLIVKVDRIPEVGETVLGGELKTAPGGKGANQAVSSAKLGASTAFVGRVGSDAFGERLVENMRDRGVDVAHVIKDEVAHTGIALIIVDARGRNVIAVAPGANGRCQVADVRAAEDVLRSSDALLLQLEIPLPVVQQAARIADESGVQVILNPAPARKLPAGVLEHVSVLTPNEKEASVLVSMEVRGVESAKRAGERLLAKGVKNVVVTLGAEGAVAVTGERSFHIPGVAVRTVDTTGAGDAFCGALAVALASGKSLREAVLYANCAGALATTKIGAQEALPTASELARFMEAKRV